MAEMKVTYQKLEDVSSTLDESAGKYMSLMMQIKDEIDKIKLEQWDSAAASKFRTQFEELLKNFEGYKKVINEYSAYLSKTAKAYKAQDDKILEQTSVLDASALFK